MEKNLTPQRHVFSPSSQYPHGERMFEEGKSTNRIVHVVFPYTFRRPALHFRSFSIKPVESARSTSSSIGFSFSAFFFRGSVEAEMTQERDQKRHQKRDFETRTRTPISTV